MEKNPETTSLIPKMTKFGKWAVLILLVFILVWPLSAGLYWTVYKAYAFLDPTRFPGLDQNMLDLLKKTPPDSDQAHKGAALSVALRNRLEQEMNWKTG